MGIIQIVEKLFFETRSRLNPTIKNKIPFNSDGFTD